ncbi:MAG TPA: hypothetical protein ENI81_11295 [Phycisphaerales bacterium]|nr:hypothetical protein [Phycisphaerales bacterium]
MNAKDKGRKTIDGGRIVPRLSSIVPHRTLNIKRRVSSYSMPSVSAEVSADVSYSIELKSSADVWLRESSSSWSLNWSMAAGMSRRSGASLCICSIRLCSPSWLAFRVAIESSSVLMSFWMLAWNSLCFWPEMSAMLTS